MIDRIQLTEALAGPIYGTRGETLAEATRILLDFPTDEQVEQALNAFDGVLSLHWDRREALEAMRAALEAVRQTMIGEG